MSICAGLVLAAICGLAEGASLRLTTLDSTGSQPVPCRLYLKDAAGKPVQPERLLWWKDHFVCPGEVELELVAGNYTYEIDRGPEYFVSSGVIALAESKSQSITNRLRRLARLAEEGGDTHFPAVGFVVEIECGVI